jgi:hypothetical protein
VSGAVDKLDFTSGVLPGGTLSFPARRSSARIDIYIAGDKTVESDEQFQINLSNPVGATIGKVNAVVKILNDDKAAAPSPVPKPPVPIQPTPVPAPPVSTNPTPTPTPVPTPVPAPVPAPPVIVGVDQTKYFDRSLIKKTLVDTVFSRDGFPRRISNNGCFTTRAWFDLQSDDPTKTGWVNRAFLDPGSDGEAFLGDLELAVYHNMSELNPFELGPDGLRIKMIPITDAMRAKLWPTFAMSPSNPNGSVQLRDMRFISGQVRLEHPEGPPPSTYQLYPDNWYTTNGYPVPVRNENAPWVCEIDPKGSYVSVKMKSAGISGQWPAICIYNYQNVFEFDVAEVIYTRRVSDGSKVTPVSVNFHKWKSTPHYPSPIVHKAYTPVPVDGSAWRDSDNELVDYGVLFTPGRCRYFQNEILVADFTIEVIDEPLTLQVLNQCIKGGTSDWIVGPMSVADAANATLTIEHIQVYNM